MQNGEEFTYMDYHWIKLDEIRGEILAISKYTIATQSLDNSQNLWTKSSLRKWLNRNYIAITLTFYGGKKEYFLQFKRLLAATSNNRYQLYCFDKVSLLSAKEYEKYKEFLLPIKQTFWTLSPTAYKNATYAVNLKGELEPRDVKKELAIRPLCLFSHKILKKKRKR